MAGALFGTLLLLAVAQAPSTDALIRARAERSAAGDSFAADRILAELEAARGTQSLPLASWSLIQDAKIALAQGRTERAVFLAEAATRLSPDLPASHATLLSAYFAYPPATMPMLVRAAFALFCSMFAGTPLANLFLYAALGMSAAIVTFALVQLAKHARATGWWLIPFAVVPPLFELGAVTSVVIVLAATHAYAHPHARRASFAALLFCGVGAYAVELALQTTLHLEPSAHDTLVRALITPMIGVLPPWGPAVLASLAALYCAWIAYAGDDAVGKIDGKNTSLTPPAALAIIPGANDLLTHRPLRGFALFAVFATSLAAIYWLEGLLPDPAALGTVLFGAIPKLFVAGNTIVVLILISTERPA
jgi:hypothetical protein